MADVLNIGTSALLSLQRAISVTGHNIANVNTEGYSRQQVNFAAVEPTFISVGFLGNGVEIASITRSYNEFLAGDVRDRTSSAAAADTLADLTGRIDGILTNPNTGLAPALDQFFSAVQDVANNPGSLPERQVMIAQGEVLADRFSYLDSQFRTLQTESNVRIDGAVREINALATSIADINDQIAQATQGGASPNDLLDSREQLLTRLSELVGTNTVQQQDGSVNVFIGNGQSLVIGGVATQLTTFQDPNDPTITNVGVSGPAEVDVSALLSGGELGAVLSFRNEVIDAARSQLGLVAVGVAETFNQQQALGMDLNGDPGVDLFSSLSPAIGALATNTGTGSLSATIDDASSLTGDDYVLSFDGTDYTLRNANTGATQVGAGPSFSVDGVTITVSGTPAAGDTFTIAPVREAANLFEVSISDPRQIAAASPLRSNTSLDNAGNGTLTELSVDDAAGLPLAGTVTLTFNPDALGVGVPGYDVAGIAGGPIAYDSATDAAGIDVTLGGFSLRLEGTPAAGDTFTIENNVDGTGDNRNALAMVGLQSERVLLGGTASFQDTYGSLVAGVAVRGGQAAAAAQTEADLLNQSIAARDSANGVNLDEEAANLLRYQQAYQAAAQVIRVADEVFQVLLNATSR
ncbi:MAG: flagellar hook-associated protein FlgK [Pseudomonadota bacterium]